MCRIEDAERSVWRLLEKQAEETSRRAVIRTAFARTAAIERVREQILSPLAAGTSALLDLHV